jgi:hypothetical protein
VNVYTTTVEVDTETGSRVVIDVIRDDGRDTYTVTFAGELLDQSPEGLTASVQLALHEIRSWRRLG